MKIQQFNPKMISITQLRRDIGILEKVLTREDEALVMRNQSLMFVAIKPERYQRLQDDQKENQTIERAVAVIGRIREGGKKFRRISVSDYVSKTREQRIKKWKK